MKAREPRQKVLIQARMRVGTSWCDAAILNLSSKGLLLQSPEVPPRGSYVEVRRGRHVIIARVIWTTGARAGLCAQEKLPVEDLICRPDGPPALPASQSSIERRARPRLKDRHDSSRLLSRSFEFACIALFGAFAASLVYSAVDHSLAKPLSQVLAALGG